ncbi:MAG TPA: hypothetical protein VGB64_09055 [Actinomycetota bacterium]|jgi:hypothetical protein
MTDLSADITAELERIAALDPAERAAAAESLEARLRAALDELAGA